MAETYLGLRHGPMSFVRTNTVVICLLSNDPWNRRYEVDLVRDLRAKGLGYLVGVCDDDGDRSDEITQLFDAVTPALLPQAPDPVRTAFEILTLQILSYRLSLRAGLNPDNPSPAGVITRVVQGIHIYE
jgi:tagatose-6-phosphate ketose/aldose isomerase